MDHLATTSGLLDADALHAWEHAWSLDPEATIFHHPAWAEVSIGPASAASARLIHAGDDAVCPVRIDGDTLRFITDAHVTDLASPVGRIVDATALAEGLLDLDWAIADLDGFRGSRWLDPMRDAFASLGCDCEAVRVDVTPRIELPGGFDDYLASVGSKQRHEIRRKARRLERELEPWIARLADAGTLDEDVDAFIAQHRLAEGEKGRFMTAEHERLFRHVAATMAQRGWLRLVWLETLSGARLAAVWAFGVRGEWLVWNSSFEPAHRELSPGTVAMAEAIRIACEDGARAFDLLRGDETYKYRLGAVDEPVWSLRVARRGA